MQIITNSINFKSKNPTIKKADKALRIIHSKFPVASPSKFAKFSTLKSNPQYKSIVERMATIVTLIRMKILPSEANDSPTVFYKKFLDTLNKHNIGNCGELVKLVNFILGLNGIKAEKANLCPSSLNHCVSIIPLKENALNNIAFEITPLSKMKDILVVDPWLDIVDYAPNVATLFKNHPSYNKFLGNYKSAINYDDFIPCENLYDIYLHPVIGSQHEVTEEVRAHFKATNPELFL